MITSASLYFARQDQFLDPFEGRFSEGNSDGHSPSDEAFYRAHKLDRSIETAIDQTEIHRSCVFISCWHRNRSENREMWQAYTQNEDSVVITTSVKALSRFVRGLGLSAIDILRPRHLKNCRPNQRAPLR